MFRHENWRLFFNFETPNNEHFFLVADSSNDNIINSEVTLIHYNIYNEWFNILMYNYSLIYSLFIAVLVKTSF